MFSVNYIFLLNITYVFAIITCLGFLVSYEKLMINFFWPYDDALEGVPAVQLFRLFRVVTFRQYRIRPNRRPGRLRKFVLYHKCQKIVKWTIISVNKVKSQDKDRQVGDNK